MNHVILGASAAGLNAAKTLRKLDAQANITVVSKDTHIYSRCMLHLLISGTRDTAQLTFVPADFFEKWNIRWEKGVSVTAVDFDQKTVSLENGKTLPYDRLLITTGSEASIPPIEGLRSAKNVFKVRHLDDAEQIKHYALSSKRAIVIGAGLIGLDAASALLKQGLEVSIVEMGSRLLPLQLDETAATAYQSLFEKAGATFYLGASIRGTVLQGGAVTAVKLGDGTELPCDFVVAAAGVRPQTAFMQDARLKVERGIATDGRMRTTVSDVYAAGDVTGRSAIWPQAVKQGIVAASNMAGAERHLDDTFTAKNAMNLLGLQTISVGLVNAPDDSYHEVSLRDAHIYKKLVYKDNKICGALLQGDLAGAGFWTQLVKEGLPVNTSAPDLFEESYADFFKIDSKGRFSF